MDEEITGDDDGTPLRPYASTNTEVVGKFPSLNVRKLLNVLELENRFVVVLAVVVGTIPAVDGCGGGGIPILRRALVVTTLVVEEAETVATSEDVVVAVDGGSFVIDVTDERAEAVGAIVKVNGEVVAVP